MATRIERRHVWDLPTRLFHWLLVGLLGFSWWSAENGRMDWHLYSGVAVLGLLVFRALWGLIGSNTARFGQFVKGPAAVWRYLRPGAAGVRTVPLGHNPLGGWSVIGLLLVLAVQVGTGLFAVDVDGIESGPFSYLLDFEQGRAAARIHEISFTLLQALVMLHVAAILFYLLVRRRNLIGAMLTGFQRHDGGSDAALVTARPWRLAIALLVAGAVAWWVAGRIGY